MRATMVVLACAVLASVGAVAWYVPVDPFDHPAHASLFPSCETCHAGVETGDGSGYPDPVSCGACHDGTIRDSVNWARSPRPRPTNLTFDHASHREALDTLGRTRAECTDCHTDLGAPRMAVSRAVVRQCLACHVTNGVADHFVLPDTACTTCHVPLARSTLTEDQVRMFEEPATHRDPSFAAINHGRSAGQPVHPSDIVAQDCATCHARDFCITCHVDAPEQPVVQALALDRRSLAHVVVLEAPADHARDDFLSAHGGLMAEPTTCASCHTAESCTACHVATPAVARKLPAAGPGRGPGARTVRHTPPSHDAWFAEHHGTAAATSPETCAACHARRDCLDCHRPDAAAAFGYHEPTFLPRHPVAAYVRQTDCSSCHHQQAFCADCHAAAGLAAARGLGDGRFHDGQSNFVFGHGVAARQSLETCVTCHTERDCVACHSATGSRRFNPHGPGFNAERLRARNPRMCEACH